VGASLLAIRAAVGTIARTIASHCFRYWRSHNIAISSDQAARQEDVPAQAARVISYHCSGFPLSYLVPIPKRQAIELIVKKLGFWDRNLP